MTLQQLWMPAMSLQEAEPINTQLQTVAGLTGLYPSLMDYLWEEAVPVSSWVPKESPLGPKESFQNHGLTPWLNSVGLKNTSWMQERNL